jgi:hypothetical protein
MQTTYSAPTVTNHGDVVLNTRKNSNPILVESDTRRSATGASLSFGL